MNRKYKVLGVIVLTFAVISAFWYIPQLKNSAKVDATSGSFHVSVANGQSWKEIARTSYDVMYSTKKFPVEFSSNSFKIRLNKSTGEYGDVEQVVLNSCGQESVITSAVLLESGRDVLPLLLADDLNVVVLNQNNLEISWNIPEGCKTGELLIKANEYSATDKQNFNFPVEKPNTEPYTFKNNKTLVVEGNVDEVQNTIANWSPVWYPATGHPTATTYIYVNDDSQYVYVSADITSDNTDDANVDWFQITVANSIEGSLGKKYRVTDSDDTYGKCGFGITNKVTYRHQTCEIRIPKNEISGDSISFSLQYYGTLAAPNPLVSIQNRTTVNPSNEAGQVIIKGAADVFSLVDVTDDIISLVQLYVYDLSDGWSQVDNNCTADDGNFDEVHEDFTCEIDVLTPQSPIAMNQGYAYEIQASTSVGGDSVASSQAITHFFPVENSQEIVSFVTGALGAVTGTVTESEGSPIAAEFYNGIVREVTLSIYNNDLDVYLSLDSECSALNGNFDDVEEAYSCILPEELSAGNYSVTTTAWFDGDISELDRLFQLIVTAPSTPTPTPSASPTAEPTRTSTSISYTTVYVTPVPTESKIMLEYFADYIEGSGKVIELMESDKVFFSIGAEEHSITIKDILADSAVLEVASTPQRVALNLGESKSVDVTTDGVFDIGIKLESIVGEYAVLTFSRVKATTLPVSSPTALVPTTLNTNKPDESTIPAYPWWTIAVGIFGITMVALLSQRRKD